MCWNRFKRSVVAILGMVMGCGGVAVGSVPKAPATVRDGVDMTNLAFNGYLRGGPACGIGTDYESLATFSPHGKRFVVVVRKGDLGLGVRRPIRCMEISSGCGIHGTNGLN